MLKSIIKLLLIAILIAGVVLGTAWLVLIKGYPWWVVVSAFLGLFALWFGVLYIKKLRLRRKEKEFVQRVIRQDEEAIRAAPSRERRNLMELQDKWKESVDLVRSSYLRKKGNPLYVLPWYLILGESGSGKTSAIKNSNLNSPLTEVKRTAGISVTRNCDWWFFEQAIILDTAGRYTIPVEDGVDKEEWEKFLTLLAKYRRREPLNGVIITVAADKLLEKDEALLSDEGQSVRRRIDQLMRTLGAKFPVYVLVTKMDLVHGMVEFSNLLPDSTVDQAMGYINQDFDLNHMAVLDDAFTSVARNLRDLTLNMVGLETIPEPEIFLFNNGFERLRTGLNYFVKAVFEDNPYQESPQFRGLFFSSAIQEGKLSLDDTGFGMNGTDTGDIHNNGLFLKDFFKEILPNDRYLFTPLREMIDWRRVTRNTGLLAWSLFWLCLCGFMGFSYLNNRLAFKTLTSFDQPAMTMNIGENLHSLDVMRSRLGELEKVNRRWIIPQVGFRESRAVEVTLKIRYLTVFRDSVLYPFDKDVISKITTGEYSSDSDELMKYYDFLTARITLLQERVSGKKTYSSEKFTSVTSEILAEKYPDITPETAALFGTQYLFYLSWNENTKEFEAQLGKFRSLLQEMMSKETTISDIIVNSTPDVPDVTLSDFWDNLTSDENRNSISVPGLYTAAAQKYIDTFFTTLESSIVDPSWLQEEKNKFWQTYQGRYYDAWRNFATFFQMDLSDFEPGANLHHLASVMTTDTNPYFVLLERMATEFAGVQKVDKEPQWVVFIQELDDIRKQALVEKEKKKGSLLGRLETQKETIVQSTLGRIDKKKGMDTVMLQRLGTIWGEFTDALVAIAPSLGSQERCYQVMSDFNMSPFSLAESKFTQLKNLLLSENEFPVIWDLIIGPEQFLVDYCARETSYVLQKNWEEQVLGGIVGVENNKLPMMLFDKSQGLVWQYLDTFGKSFITRGNEGYHTRARFKNIMPFRKEFFTFLDNGMETIVNYQPLYYVTMESLPLDVNNAAKIAPYGSIVSLQCVDSRLALDNYNYPQKQTFSWSDTKCGEVTVTILFPGITLVKTYDGMLGFPRFLSEFRDGSRIYKSEEFPEFAEELEKIGVTWIKLSYKITGADPILKFLEQFITDVPKEIISFNS